MRLARVYDCTRSSWIVVRYQGMMVSGIVGSVEAELTIGTSVFRLTRRPICVVSALIDPSMAQTLSSYAIFTISLLAAPQSAASLCTDRKSTRLNSSHLVI